MRLSSISRGGVKVRPCGTRPNSDTSESRMMARARKPCERSRCRAQLIPVATPRSTNASVVTFCNTPSTWLMAASGGAEPVDYGPLAHEQLDDLRIPLFSGSVVEHCQGFVARKPRPVRTVVD